ncbi:translation machinery-associated protein 16 homolog [Anopheles stephensi]|uniref:translation machinery-associated protein 16 homolog n=1 Tax=Anopheles stephensi TaxID=30069 RepID=UPI001658AC08|nr:translation machinery-associated protein 16 homolog [Anopheles stephensi]
MPKQTILKELAKCKHPKSRKTLALTRKVKKINNREKIKLGHAAKANLVGKKLAWFAEQLAERQTPLTKSEFEELIDGYLQRFDKELEQIRIVQSIGKHRATQHAAREAVIKTTIDTEKLNFNSGGGIELPDLCDATNFKLFQEWDGSAATIQHLTLKFVSRKSLRSSSASKVNVDRMDE